MKPFITFIMSKKVPHKQNGNANFSKYTIYFWRVPFLKINCIYLYTCNISIAQRNWIIRQTYFSCIYSMYFISILFEISDIFYNGVNKTCVLGNFEVSQFFVQNVCKCLILLTLFLTRNLGLSWSDMKFPDFYLTLKKARFPETFSWLMAMLHVTFKKASSQMGRRERKGGGGGDRLNP